MIPQYNRSRERTMDKQAQSILKAIRAGERSYNLDTGLYYSGASSVSDINSGLQLDLVDDGEWVYSVTGTSGFTATMTRNKGGYNRTWTITSGAVNATCTGSCP